MRSDWAMNPVLCSSTLPASGARLPGAVGLPSPGSSGHRVSARPRLVQGLSRAFAAMPPKGIPPVIRWPLIELRGPPRCAWSGSTARHPSPLEKQSTTIIPAQDSIGAASCIRPFDPLAADPSFIEVGSASFNVLGWHLAPRGSTDTTFPPLPATAATQKRHSPLTLFTSRKE